MPGPLDGLVVVDSTWGTPGAIATMLLADYGASVIKVERPGGGPDASHVSRFVFERGKRSVELDLRSVEGVDALDRLLADADVFLESNRPGEAAAMGFGPSSVRARHPHLVYVSLSAYGQDTPDAGRPGFDCLVAARMGLMVEVEPGTDRPIFLGHQNLAYTTAFLAVISTLSALHARRSSGTGQLIDVSLLDAVLAQSPMNWLFNEAGQSYLAKDGEVGFGRNRIVTDIFRCGDGEHVMVHSGGDGGFKTMMTLLGYGDEIRTINGLEMSVPLDDVEYDIARFQLPAVFETRPRAEWIEMFHSVDLAALPVLRPGEVLDDPQVQHAGVVIELPGPDGSTLRQVGPVIKFRDSPAAVPTGAPAVGTDNALLAAPLRVRERVLMPTPGDAHVPPHALAGLRVLDFSSFFATAYGAKLLSDLGADVIKVETPGGDQLRPLPEPFEACQRGKRMLAVDLKSAEGRSVIRDLVASSDVIMHNLRPGKAEKLGIGYDELVKVRPDLLYAYLPGFGSTGPKAHLKSFAPLVSGFTGLLYEGAGAGNEPVRRVLGNEDYYNGFLGAVTVLMGLLHRDVTGRGQYIECPQLHSSLFTTTGRVVDAATGALVPNYPLDSTRTGFGPLYRNYPTADGWLTLACVGDGAFGRLVDALGLDRAVATTASAADGALVALLSERLAQLRSEDAFALLDGAGVPCEIPAMHPVLPDFLWYPWAEDSQRVLTHQHHRLGYIREVGFVTHLSDTPCANKGPQEMLGKHSIEILRDLGYDDTRIETLLERTVIDLSVPSSPARV